MMDDKGKTRGNQKVRMNLIELCAWGDLELVQLRNKKLANLKAT